MVRRRPLSLQIALPFALFVVVGSLVLVFWLAGRNARDSREAFRRMAEANAAFIVRSKLPPGDKLAEDLSAVLEVDVKFGNFISFHAVPGEVYTDNLGESVLIELEADVDVVFSRPRQKLTAQIFRGSTLMPLATFWGLSLVLAAVISRRLVRPIHSLAAGVEKLESTEGEAATLAGAERGDEIGQLSRALSETHGRLISERARREEGERAALLGKMATGLAHEIRNPVAAVRMHAQLLERCENCGDASGTIVAEADVIEGLVNQWMFLARPVPPDTGEYDLANPLANCLDAAAPAAEHAGVELRRDFPQGLFARVDVARIAQAFRNIILNAIHAMPQGGGLEVSGRDDSGWIVIVFDDSGSGFTEEALERYGELFYSTKEGGMGVGLSVSSEIVAAHGGELHAENREGGGARVTIRIPACEREDMNHE